MFNISEKFLITKVSNGASAGTSAVNSTAVKMDGYDGVLFICDLGTVVDASVMTATAQQGAASDGSDATAITGGATSSVTASTSSNGYFLVDVQKPTGRYVRLNFTRTAQNATVNSIYAVRYNAKNAPVSQSDTALLASKVLVGQ